MPDYKEMYLTMMRAADKALELNQEAAKHIIEAQKKADELYIEAEDTPLQIFPQTPEKE